MTSLVNHIFGMKNVKNQELNMMLSIVKLIRCHLKELGRCTFSLCYRFMLFLLILMINLTNNTSIAAAQDQFSSPIQISIGEGGSQFASNFQISSDGQHVVYQVNKGLFNDLYSVPIEGGVSVRLNTGLAFDRTVSNDFEVSPDGQYVVFRANQPLSNLQELFSVPIEGGTVVRLNTNLVTNGAVFSFKISQNSQRVIYSADQSIEDVNELFSVAIEGGTPVRLNADLALGGNVDIFNFDISSDSQRVVYEADQNNNNVFELFSVSVNGGTPVRLNADFVLGGDLLGDFQISSDSKRVVYLADQNTDNIFELFSVPIEGGAPARLNASLVPGGSVFNSFQISPNDQQVIYLADQNTDGVNELFSVSISGGEPVRLNSDLVTNGNVMGVQISANSQRVVYSADQNINGIFELFSVPINGGESVKLNSALIGGAGTGGVLGGDFQISPDSQRVVYYSNFNAENVDELFSVPIDGGSPLRLNDSLTTSVIIFQFRFQISPDSQRVLFLANQGSQNPRDSRVLYSVPTLGGSITRINNDEPVSSGDVSIFQISSDSQQIVYLDIGDFGTTNQRAIYSVEVSPLPEELCVPIRASNGSIVVVCL